MTDTLGQCLACAGLAQFGLQWIDSVEELLGEAEDSGYVEEDTAADPGIARLDLLVRRVGDAGPLGDLLRGEVLQVSPFHASLTQGFGRSTGTC